MGIQSNLIVALMRIYKDLVEEETSIILIDEPEVFLHPHSCRHFFGILNDLSLSGTQIVYSTHSPYFIDPENPRMIYLVRHETETKVYRYTEMTDRERLKFVSKFDPSFSEVFFATKVILVEGDIDKIALERAFEVKEINLDKENISILVCGSINEIPFIARLLTSFKISCYVLCDSDPSKPTEPKNAEIKNIIGEKCTPKKLPPSDIPKSGVSKNNLPAYIVVQNACINIPRSYANVRKTSCLRHVNAERIMEYIIDIFLIVS